MIIARLEVGAILAFLLLCIAGIIVGAIGLARGRKKKKQGNPPSNARTAMFSIFLTGGLLVIVPLVCIFLLAFAMCAIPPLDFVETDVIIAEEGYQGSRFTANGVVYERLAFEVEDEEAIGDAVFAYKTEGIWHNNERGNYFLVENDQGFHLVCD